MWIQGSLRQKRSRSVSLSLNWVRSEANAHSDIFYKLRDWSLWKCFFWSLFSQASTRGHFLRSHFVEIYSAEGWITTLITVQQQQQRQQQQQQQQQQHTLHTCTVKTQAAGKTDVVHFVRQLGSFSLQMWEKHERMQETHIFLGIFAYCPYYWPASV